MVGDLRARAAWSAPRAPPSATRSSPPRRHRHAVRQAAAVVAELVEQARDLAGVAPELRLLLLELIDLLDHVDRDDDVVVGELRESRAGRGAGRWCRGRNSSFVSRGTSGTARPWSPAPPARYAWPSHAALAVPPRRVPRGRSRFRRVGSQEDVVHLALAFALPRVMVTFFMTTSVTGLSRGPRSTLVNFGDERQRVALAEDGVAAVEVGRRPLGDEELRAVRPRPGVGHRQERGLVEGQVGRNSSANR